jgi:hypothetical protein
MSTTPIARQVRRAVRLDDGTLAFEVTTTIVDPGSLPSINLFVVNIINALDPKADVLAQIATPKELVQSDPTQPIFIKVVATDLITISPDTFARVANIADVTALPTDRTVAVRSGLTSYLTSSVTITYPDVVTATAGFQTIVARLSDLVVAWGQASGTFNTNPSQDYPLPQTATSVESQLIATYQAQVAVLQTAQAARDAAQAALTSQIQTCTSNRTIYQLLTSEVSFLQQALNIISGLHAFTTPPPGAWTISDPAHDFATGTGMYAGNPTTFAALLVQKQAAQTQYQALVRDCTAQVQTLQTSLLQAQATVNSAQTNVNAALAAVLSVCPSFNPVTLSTGSTS